MKTLNLEGFRAPMVKILTATLLVSSLIIVPRVWANETITDVAATIVRQFHLTPTQVNNLLLVNDHATESNQPEALQALMLQESGANVNVKSSGNCHGIMQIMTSTAQSILKADETFRIKYFGERYPAKAEVVKQLKTDPVFSIEIADKLLAQSLERTDSLERAVLVYNVGSSGYSSKNNPTKYTYVRSVFHKIHHIIKPIQQIISVSPTLSQ